MTPDEAMRLISNVATTIEAMTKLMMVQTEEIARLQDKVIVLEEEVNRINDNTIQFLRQ